MNPGDGDLEGVDVCFVVLCHVVDGVASSSIRYASKLFYFPLLCFALLNQSIKKNIIHYMTHTSSI